MATKAGKKPRSTRTEKKQALKPKSAEKMKRRAKSKAKKPEDPNKPKKPPTAFFYYLEDFRKDYQAQNPNVKSMRDVGKACGEKWKTMAYEEKVKYYDIATEKRAEFDKAIKEYERKKETGEDQDDLGDSEYDEYC